MNLKIANRLVALRKEHGLSQDALAEKLGVSRQAVSKWERGEAAPDTDNFIALAELYNVTLDSLLGYQKGERNPVGDDTVESQTVSEEAVNDWNGETPQGSDAENGEAASGREDFTETEQNNFAEGSFSFRFQGEKQENKEEPKKAHVHFGKDGFKVAGENGETVHISPKGVFVENDREKVDVSWHGVHVERKDGSPETWWRYGEKFPCGYSVFHKLPDLEGIWFLLSIVGYLLLGFLANAWHPGWLIFFAVPVLGGLTRPWKYMGSLPVIVVGVYLTLGLVGGWWHPGWVVFFAIPVFYILVEIVKKVRKK